MYETNHSVGELEVGYEILWNGHEYTVTDVSENVIELDNQHKVDTDDAEQWFASEDVPFEIIK